MEKLIQQFLTFRKAENLSPRSIKDYTYHLSKFALLMESSDAEEPFRDAVLTYLSNTQNPNYFNIKFKYLKKFFDWCSSEKLLNIPDPLRGLKKRRPQNRIVNISEADIIKLIDLPDKSTFTGYRNYCIILFSLDTACRPSETLQLIPHDFNFSNLSVTIPAKISKSRQAATLPISSLCSAAVRKLLEYHDASWQNPTVFCTETGGRFQGVSWSRRLKKYGEEIDVYLTAYSLRHIACLNFLKNGMNLATLSSGIMRHSDINITKIYLNIGLDTVREAHSQCSILNKVAPVQSKRLRKIA